MKTRRQVLSGTAKKLLAAASVVFAEKGYRDATIAEISERAGANIASVNYHFGDKETLYKEAWRHSFAESVKAHPPAGGVSEDAPVEERLRGQITALLHRIADENNKEFSIVQKELANPTGLLEQVMDQDLRPLHDAMATRVREILGPSAPDQAVQFCVISIMSQCINPMVARKGAAKNRDARHGPPEIEDMNAYSGHVVKFSFAGIRAVCETLPKKPGGFRSRSARLASLGKRRKGAPLGIS